MNAELIAIGSELLLGETVDTNSAFVARQLTAIGVNLFRKTVVGDNQERIQATIEEALRRADLVICTGGLGPTADDVTREAVAAAFGRPLEFHQFLLDQIAARFASFGRPMSPSNRQQAFVPHGARIIENPVGTAPCFLVEDERGTVVVLPGVPSEMRYLLEHAVLPYLRDDRGQTGVILVRTLHATGEGESVIGEKVADLMRQSNPTLGISAKRARYELRLGASASSRAEAEAMLDTAEATIRERLGPLLIGNENLETSVVQTLSERDMTLALFEGTMHAPVYQSLAATPGGLDVLRGTVIQPIDMPLRDDQIDEVVQAGALSVSTLWRSDLILGVQPAAAPGDDGFTSVAMVLMHRDGTERWSRRFDLAGAEGWGFVATAALDGIRRFLLGA